MEHPARAFPLNAPARTEAGVPAEVRYRMLVEQIPAVTYIADFTADAPFLYVSPQIEQLLGFPVDSWIENDDLWGERIHPDDRERVLAAERLTYEQAIPYEGEFRMLAADGRVVWIWERDTIIRDDDGRPVCTQGVLVDVTELKRTQSALQESEALVREERDRAQGYLDIAATMIVVLAADGTISLVNRRACEVLGRAEAELLGSDWFAVAVPEAERESARRGFDQVIRGEVEGITRVRERRDGRLGRGAADPLAQHGAPRRRRTRDRVARIGRGHHRPPPRRAARGLPRLSRPADRASEPRAALGERARGDRERRASPAARWVSSAWTSTTSSW